MFVEILKTNPFQQRQKMIPPAKTDIAPKKIDGWNMMTISFWNGHLFREHSFIFSGGGSAKITLMEVIPNNHLGWC